MTDKWKCASWEKYTKMYPRDMPLNTLQFRINMLYKGIKKTTSKFTMYVLPVGKQVYAPLCTEKYNTNMIG